MRKYSPYREREMEIKMTPMVDIVFLLLVFFVWTASFHIAERDLPVDLTSQLGQGSLSEESPPPEIEFEQIVVRIFSQPGLSWTINDLPMDSWEELQDRLARLATVNRDVSLIIHPETKVPLGNVIDVFDISRLSGFSRIQFATSRVSP